MAIITFISDFGTVDHYVATVKGVILSQQPTQLIVDITHDIRPYDILQGSIILKDAFREFPKKTVHLAAIDAMKERSAGIAIALEGHFFVSFDCGFLSMISDKKPDKIVKLELGDDVFPAKTVLAKTALELAQGKPLKEVGLPQQQMVEIFARQLKVTKREIAGNISGIDNYGNLITNITKTEFDTIITRNGNCSSYTVRFGREEFSELNTFYSDVDPGECYILFNSSGFLQIGINQGRAPGLLGLSIDAPVSIEFTQ